MGGALLGGGICKHLPVVTGVFPGAWEVFGGTSERDHWDRVAAVLYASLLSSCDAPGMHLCFLHQAASAQGLPQQPREQPHSYLLQGLHESQDQCPLIWYKCQDGTNEGSHCACLWIALMSYPEVAGF